MNGLWILAAAFKWIGIALLALLLLLLLIVLLVLFSPVRYSAEGRKGDAASGAFGVSWLLGAIRLRGAYTPEGGMALRLKLLWFTLLGGEPDGKKGKKKKKEKKRKAREREKAEPAAPVADSASNAANNGAGDAGDAVQGAQPIGAREKTDPPRPEGGTPGKPPAPKAQEMRRQAKTVRRVKLEEIEELPPEPDFLEDEAFFTGEGTGDAGEEPGKGLPPAVSALLHMEGKGAAFAALGKLLKRLAKGILPGNLFLKGTFGTGDPTTTGYLLAAAGVLTARFGRDIQVKGEFSRAAAEDIEVRAKGRIVPAYLLWAALAFLCAKPVRRMLWKLWKMRKEI